MVASREVWASRVRGALILYPASGCKPRDPEILLRWKNLSGFKDPRRAPRGVTVNVTGTRPFSSAAPSRMIGRKFQDTLPLGHCVAWWGAVQIDAFRGRLE